MGTPATSRFYRPELDALRFSAFSLVFLKHTCASIIGPMLAAGGVQWFVANLSSIGAYGVDLFFVLSAYLITELFLREKSRTNRIDVGGFYRRRILRIWPLYFFFVGATFILSRFTPVQFPSGALIPMLMFFGNWWIMLYGTFSPGGILWSVSVEEQFYVCAPFAARFLSRRGLAILAVGMIAVAVMARWLMVTRFGIAPDALWYGTLSRLDPIALGVLICVGLHGGAPTWGWLPRTALLVGGVLCLGVAAIGLHGGGQGDITLLQAMLNYPVADFGVVALFLAIIGLRITWRPLLYLGRISYGLYVYHLLALDISKVVLLHFTGACPFWQRGLFGLAITIPMAMISYRWLETPFLRLKNTRIRIAAPAETPGSAIPIRD
jgi:peptidoglycan/LPS O-acetylase OafA/YrhL